MARFELYVVTKAADGKVDELATWYDNQHIPDLLRVPGIVGARRNALRKLGGPAGTVDWDYMAIYEIEADDPMTVMAEMGKRYGTEQMPRSPALDSSLTLTLMATPQFRA